MGSRGGGPGQGSSLPHLPAHPSGGTVPRDLVMDLLEGRDTHMEQEEVPAHDMGSVTSLVAS